MTIGISLLLLAVSETTTWGWGSARTLSLLAVGLIICAGWVAIDTFVMASVFLAAALGAGFLIPLSSRRRASRVSPASTPASDSV